MTRWKMEVQLSKNWGLSTLHGQSKGGAPVLVHYPTARAYTPDETIRPFPGWELMSARQATVEMAKTQSLDAEQKALVRRFAKG